MKIESHEIASSVYDRQLAAARAMLAALKDARSTFKVEYNASGRAALVSYGSEALPELIALLDSAIAAAEAAGITSQ